MKIIFDSYKEKEKWIETLSYKIDVDGDKELDQLYIAASGADIAGHHGKKCAPVDYTPINRARDRFQEAVAEMPPQEPLAGVQVQYTYTGELAGNNRTAEERGWNDIQQAGGLA